MCEPGCECCWFQKTNKVLHQLRSKSEDVTRQLDNAARCMNSVQNTVNDFITSFNELGTLTRDETQARCTEESKKRLKNDSTEYPKEDDVVFVKVTTGGLSNDCTFWCTYWYFTGSFPFNDSRLHHISDELGWMAKDLSAEKVESKASEQLLFCYSSVHELYLRTVILKYAPPEVEVRFIDLGRTEFVAPNMTYYKLPEDNPKKHPFLKLYCTLYYEDEKKVLPRLARWCFRDQTNEKILMAKIVGCSQHNGIPLYKVEMKTMDEAAININREVMKKVLEHEKAEERKKEERKKEERMEIEQKDIERKEKEIKEKEKQKAMSCKVSKPGPDKTSKSIDNTRKEHKPEKVTENIHAKVTENIHAKEEKSPSLPYISEDKSQRKNEKIPLADRAALKNALILSLTSKDDLLKNGRPRRSSESIVPENTKLLILNRSSSMSNIENVDPASINLNGEVKSKCTVENAEEGVQKNNLKEQKPKFELESNVYWVDMIPEEQRRMVPKRMAPLRNLFYNKDRLRQAHWYEIELMNINELLNSESKMFFYALPMSRKDLENSFSNNYIALYHNHRYGEKYRNFLTLANERFGSSSQYFFVLNETETYINGIAKIEVLWKVQGKDKMFIQYYCLSNMGEHKIKYSNDSAYYIDNKFAKTLVLKFKASLECNRSVPTFENYYPWCGIPPLMDIKKPIYPQLPQPPKRVYQNTPLQRTNQKTRRSREDLQDHQQQRGPSFANRDHSAKRGGKKPQNWRQRTENIQQSHAREEYTDNIIHTTEELWDQDDMNTKVGVDKTSSVSNEVMSSSTVEIETYANNIHLSTPEVVAHTTGNSQELYCGIVHVNGSTQVGEEIVDTQDYDFSCRKLNTTTLPIATSVESVFPTTTTSVESVFPTTTTSVESVFPIVTSVESVFPTTTSVESVFPTTTTTTPPTTTTTSVESAFPTATSVESSFPAATLVESKLVTVPLEDDSRPASCYGYEANERFEGLEEDWSVNGNGNCTSKPINANIVKQMEEVVSNELKNNISIGNSADEKSANSEWEEDAKDLNHVTELETTQKQPIRILQRPPSKNVGFYDGSGMWYPDMDTAVLAFRSSIKVFNDEYVRKCEEEKEGKSKDPENHYDENDNLPLHKEGLIECSVLESTQVVPDTTT